MPAKYTSQDAIAKIRSILNNGGAIEPTWHCRHDSMATRDVDDLDLGTLFAKTFNIKGQPVWNEKHQNFVYKVVGKDAVGDDLTAITVIDEANMELTIITVF